MADGKCIGVQPEIRLDVWSVPASALGPNPCGADSPVGGVFHAPCWLNLLPTVGESLSQKVGESALPLELPSHLELHHLSQSSATQVGVHRVIAPEIGLRL